MPREAPTLPQDVPERAQPWSGPPQTAGAVLGARMQNGTPMYAMWRDRLEWESFWDSPRKSFIGPPVAMGEFAYAPAQHTGLFNRLLAWIGNRE